MTKPKKILISLGGLAAAVLITGGIWYFVSFRVVRVPSGSMANTIIPGDSVLCSKSARTIARGDIVLFRYPPAPEAQYLMRVIGLPGETIELRGVKVLINGRELIEARTYIDMGDGKGALKELGAEGEGRYRAYYIKRESENDENINGARYAVKEPFEIPQEHYFVLGDSRDNSLDSRFWGAVPRELVTGKALMIVDSPGSQSRAFKMLK